MSTKYALISVSDKSGIVDFGKQISKLGYQIISTGGTAKVLKEAGLKIIPIQEVTGNPESFDGRMKTISFQIEGGILFDRDNKLHVRQASELGIKPIDLVVCNLYPFEETISKNHVDLDEAIENIDVGGPTMIRAAAKNFKSVLVVVDSGDYQKVVEYLKNVILVSKTQPGSSKAQDFGRTKFARMTNEGYSDSGKIAASRIPRNDAKEALGDGLRKELAAKAFWHLSLYDSIIAKYLSKEQFPEELTIALRKDSKLRYGENPHQEAAFYLKPGTNSPLKSLKRFWGRGLSLVNLTDINAGLESIRSFDKPAAVVIKHNTPCGIALGSSPSQALQRAIDADPESAFGGVIVTNQPFDLKSAKIIASFKEERRGNIDIIAATKIEEDALDLLKKVRKTMGIYSMGKIQSKLNQEINLKWVEGGLIVQTPDNDPESAFKNWEVVTKLKPTKEQMDQMRTAWVFLTKMRSNAVIVVDKKLPMTRGIGTGQTSRVRSTKIALDQAGDYCKDGILASDSFFPFGDSVGEAARYGIGAIIQQGDSINDQQSIDAANKANIPMIFTHHRAFWH